MMKRKLLIALVLIALAGVIFTVTMTSLGWDFSALGSHACTTTTYTVEEGYSDIKITAITADITFTPATDGKTTVTSYADEGVAYNVSVSDGTLLIEMNDSRAWYEKIVTGGATLTVSIPAEDYATLNINLTTGDVDLPSDFSFNSIAIKTTTGDIESRASASGDVNIKATTGDVTLNGIAAENINIDINTGDININNITVEKKLKIEGTTGDVKMCLLLAGEIEINVSTGDVIATLKAPMIITAKATTGDISVPGNTGGGNCSITTTTGDITVTYCE